MNHELVMLKGAIQMKKSAKLLNKTAKKLALSSYNTTGWRDGTIGQAEEIVHCMEKSDKLMYLYNATKSALNNLPVGQRALLNEVYVKRTDKRKLCSKYNVSMSTMYRKLACARKALRGKFTTMGITAEWLQDNYGNIVIDKCNYNSLS